ncbi:MAG: FIST N-terminal domain-containing protein [Candidatus Hodarchaeales archaeon]
MKVTTGLYISHDLEFATVKALDQAGRDLNEDPSLILYFTGSHKNAPEVYERSLSLIRKKYPSTPLAGCSGVGMANSRDHGLKGASIMLFYDVRAETHLVKRFRIFNRFKSWEIMRKCQKIVKKNSGMNSSFIFFPPGLGFPKFMVNLLNHRIEGFNPFFIMNLPIWRKIPQLSFFASKITGFLMDLAGIGISYSSTWYLLTSLYEKGVHFTGTFGVDPLTMNKSFQFYNNKAVKDSLVYVSISSNELEFQSRTDTGAKINPTKTVEFDSFIDGGFVPSINGKWGADALLKLFEMEKTPEILEEFSRRYFYYLPFRPMCVLDANNKQYLYSLAINPNLKHGLVTTPKQVAKRLNSKKSNGFKAFISNQSASTIESLLEKTLDDSVSDRTKFALFFDCANRAMLLGDRFDQYLSKFKKHLGEKPYLIILSGGEINYQNLPIVNFSMVSNIGNTIASVSEA